MPSGKRLTMLSLPQGWDGTELTLRVVALPSEDPLSPLVAGAPAFADAGLAIEAAVVPHLERLPDPADAAVRSSLGTLHAPNARAVFEALASQLDIGPTPPPRPAAAGDADPEVAGAQLPQRL